MWAYITGVNSRTFNLTNATVTATEPDPDDATALTSYFRDGDHTTDTSNGPVVNPDGEWTSPESTTIGDDYEVFLTVTSGDSPTGGPAVDTWHALTTTRSWSLAQTVVGTASGTWTISIRHATSLNVVASHVQTMTATVDA